MKYTVLVAHREIHCGFLINVLDFISVFQTEFVLQVDGLLIN